MEISEFGLAIHRVVRVSQTPCLSEFNEERLWVRLSALPRGPLALRIVAALPGASKEQSGTLSTVDVRVEFRGDGEPARRIDGIGDEVALNMLRAALEQGTLSAVVRLAEPIDTDGRPGGSGWIPWTPARPRVAFI